MEELQILLFIFQKKYIKVKNLILTLTRKEIAEFAGCSPENIIHTLTRFHKEGIINSEGKNIKILDRKRLSDINRLG